MIILGIETSCDETALSLLEIKEKDGVAHFKVLGNEVHSQIKVHEKYGGVFPMMAKREHNRNLIPLFKKLLEESGFAQQKSPAIALSDDQNEKIEKMLNKESELQKAFREYIPTIERPNIDAIAVTSGPGLEPTLWVGINFAQALGLMWDIPIVPTNHMEGHIVSALLKKESAQEHNALKPVQFPALALLISGGHTELILMKDWKHYALLGQTRDDAVGEAFDKVARLLGLPYPGGPAISKCADELRKKGESEIPYPLPRPMIHSKDYDFSFSGIKTAVLYTLKKIPELTESIKHNIAREFEDAVTEVLVSKTRRALEEFGVRTLILGGGVVANNEIRRSFETLVREYTDIKLYIPEVSLSTDNALMIALAGYYNHKLGLHIKDIKAEGNLKLGH